MLYRIRWSIRAAWSLVAAVFSLAMLAAHTPQAFAEGSRTLHPASYPTVGRGTMSAGYDTGVYAGVARNTQFLYVYAEAGEWILLGSRNRSNGGDIFVYNPQSFGNRGDETIPGTSNFTCSVVGGGTIASRAQELAGPNSADGSATVTDGFTPCSYQAPVTGIYGVRFTGATSGGGTNNGSVATPVVLQNNLVTAWDVTVRASASSLVDLNGRLHTYSWVVRTGGNGTNFRLYNDLHYVSSDGYRYRQSLRGIDPFAGAFYANSAGFLDGGAPLYKDVRGAQQHANTGPSYDAGVTAQRPQYPIFFSNVAPAGPNAAEVAKVLGALGIPLVPPVPQVTSVTYNGNIGGSTSSFSAGGTFQFSTVNTLTYQIVISRDGIDFDPANTANRTLTGTALTGTHQVIWNGRGNDEVPFPVGDYEYRLTGRNGEIHFPMVDIEGNVDGGPSLTKLNGSLDSIVYFDDRGYRTSNGTLIGALNGHLCGAGNAQVQPTPNHSLTGVDSADANYAGTGRYYRHWVGSSDPNSDCASDANVYFGTAKALELWALESTPQIVGEIDIIPLAILPDVGVLVTASASVYPGDIVYGSVRYTNSGVDPATGVTYTLVIGTPGACPSGVTFPLLPPGVTASFNATTCAVTFTGMPTGMPSGSALDLNFQYTAPSSGPVPVTATIDSIEDPFVGSPRPDQPAPNIDTAQTNVIVSDVATTVTVPPTATPGSTVSGTIVFENLPTATATAEGLIYTVTIGTPGSCPAGMTFPSLPPGVIATYNSTTCQVTFTGLPTSLDPGESISIGFQYTAPASGTIPVNSGITTTTPESSTANNTDNGATVIVDPTATLTIVKTANEASVIPGNTASYTILVTNTGPSDAADVVVTDTTPAGLTFVSNAGDCITAFPCNLGTLPVGQSRTITTTFQVPANYAGANPIVNVASVTSPTDPGGPRIDDATTPVGTPTATLTIVKTANEASVILGNTASYTILVTNTGPSDAANVVVTDTTPAGLTFVSNAGDCITAFPCNLGTLPVGQSRTITTTFQVPANYAGANPILNVASVTSPTDPGGPQQDDATTPIGDALAALTIVKTANQATAVPGNIASFTIVVTNNGPSNAADVVVTDPTPVGLSFISNTGDCITAFPCSLGTLPVGQSRTIVTTFQVPANYSGPNPIHNVATVTSPTDPDGAHDDDAAVPLGDPLATLTIVKTAMQAFAVRGQNVNFTILVSNSGPSDASNVVVTDPTPPGLSFIANAGACATPFPCSLGTLPAGESRTITSTFLVPANYGGPDPILNIASVTSPTDPGGPHIDDASVPIQQFMEPVAVPVNDPLTLVLLLLGMIGLATIALRGRAGSRQR